MSFLERDWTDDAACKGLGDLFFAPANPNAAGGRPPAFDYGPALAICAQCPVLEQCRAWAVNTGELDRKGRAVHGVVAGLVPNGKVPQPKAECGTEAGYKRHLREGRPACASCLSANRRAHQDWKNRTRRAS